MAGLTPGALAGIIAGSVAVVATGACCAFVCICMRRRRRAVKEADLERGRRQLRVRASPPRRSRSAPPDVGRRSTAEHGLEGAVAGPPPNPGLFLAPAAPSPSISLCFVHGRGPHWETGECSSAPRQRHDINSEDEGSE